MNMKDIRKDFPILERKIHGKDLVYLDNSATTQKPRVVIDALSEFYCQHNANIHRGLHTLSIESTDLYEDAHEKTAKFLNAKSWEEIVFTRNTTESINLVAQTWGRQLSPRRLVGKPDVIVVTEMEHHSNVIPWQMLSRDKAVELVWVPIREDGTLDMDRYADIIKTYGRRIKMVAVAHISNVLGTVNPVSEIIRRAHEVGALVLVDAAQAAARQKIDVQALDVDFLAISSHKMYGPTGIGVLYGKRELLDKMDPWMGGGDMIRKVRKDSFSVNDLPWKFEAGTPNIADGAVFPEAIKYIEKIGFDFIIKHEKELISRAIEEMSKLSWIKIYGPTDPEKRMGCVTFTCEGIHPHDLASLLDEDGIAIRAGHHCTQPLHMVLKVPATARISFAVYNTVDEVNYFIECLKNARERFI